MSDPYTPAMTEMMSGTQSQPGSERHLRVLIIHEQQVFGEALAVALATWHRTMAVVGCFPDVRSVIAPDGRCGESADVILLGTPGGHAELRQFLLQLQTRYPGATVLLLAKDRPTHRGGPQRNGGAMPARPIPQGLSLHHLLKRLEIMRARLGLRPTPAEPPRGRVLDQRSTDTYGDLTPREQQIVALRGRGLSHKEIAVALQIGVQTVKNHLHTVTVKSQLRRPRLSQTPAVTGRIL